MTLCALRFALSALSSLMKIPRLYSLPPVGNEIPFSVVLRSVTGKGNLSNTAWVNHIQGYLGAKHVLYLSSGRAAFWLILKSFSQARPEKKEVIVPAFTCPSVVSAVLKIGLKPVLCDINLEDFGYSDLDLKAKITERTLAVIVVHLYGYPAGVEKVYECIAEREVSVIEDAAQAFGNEQVHSPYGKLGLIGDAGFFSFGRGKPLSIMHGGLFVTNSDEIYQNTLSIYQSLDKATSFQGLKYLLKLGSYSLFSSPHLYWLPQSVPFLNLGGTIFEPDFLISRGLHTAAWVLDEMLKYLEKNKEVRKENASWFATNLSAIPSVNRPPHAVYPYLRYPLTVHDKKLRDQVLEKLVSHGTGAAQSYPCPLNELPKLREILNDNNIYPNAKHLSQTLITLPVHAGVSPQIRMKILDLIQLNAAEKTIGIPAPSHEQVNRLTG